ncbi:putative transcriptional regulatory protein C2H10.01 [Lachnellula cervina]|uniref:Putative transcriptional regulatory protein C2H10.01 n=1 Tax=Lachnellula cervina TaxID=1316786 RepID=A0A7D8UIH5_9HELO|nr:putative transcriptional regulatory protein C2H10.01 [Lachnellula cervina]
MSYQDQSGGYPPPREQESRYPPPPGEEDDRSGAYHQRAPSTSSNVTLPSMSPYDPQYAQPPNGYGPDPRAYPPQDQYRQQAPQGYRDDRAYQQDYGRGGPQQLNFSQSAPRQRTAIACRYCRRRKIRCSGFDQNPEGRCSNCQRFQQDCIFTPVSSQAQAFVPAHTVYPGMRNMGIGPDGRPRPMYPQGTQLFGAHGQPLGPIPPPNPQASPYEYPAPSPTSSFGSGVDVAHRGSQPPHPQDPSRKRPQQDPHPSILPPPMPNQPPYQRSDSANRRSAVEDDLRLPPVTPTGGPQATSNYSPGSSTSSHSNLQPPHQQQGLPSMSRTPPPRNSPGGEGRSDPMSIGNIMERRPDTQIDRSMLGRLDRKGQ